MIHDTNIAVLDQSNIGQSKPEEWPLHNIPGLPICRSTPEQIKAKEESDQLYAEEQDAIDAYVACEKAKEQNGRDEADVLEQHRQDNEERRRPRQAPPSVSNQAEYVLSHVLRIPELFAVAQHTLTPSHFRNSGRWDLSEVWSAAKDLAKENGLDLIKSEKWPYLLEQALKRNGLSKSHTAQLFGGGSDGELGFFEKTFGLPATAFSEGRGQAQLDEFVFVAQVAGPLRKILCDVQGGDVLPAAATEKIQAIMKRHGEHSGSKPLFMPPAEFAATEFKIEWLVPGVLVAGQPCIVGGPSKSLKTSIMIDLAVSIGAGNTRFLNKFAVKNDGKRVGFISGESGGATIKETFERVCRVRELKLAECNVYPEFRLPKLGQPKEVQHLASQIRRHGLEIIIIDPIYLSLLAGNTKAKAPNLFDMGPLLADLTEACLEAGATPILVHHTVKRLPPAFNGTFEPLEREDLAMSGFSEFARQWMLINRRTPYQDDTGEHELWLRIGGSAGFSSLWGVNIVEGTVREDFSGRNWFVNVKDTAALKKVVADQKAQRRLEQKLAADLEFKQQFTTALGRFPDGETYTELRDMAGISKSRNVKYILEELVQERAAERVQVAKEGRTWSGYKLTASTASGAGTVPPAGTANQPAPQPAGSTT